MAPDCMLIAPECMLIAPRLHADWAQFESARERLHADCHPIAC